LKVMPMTDPQCANESTAITGRTHPS
jgi:hypothetical protein